MLQAILAFEQAPIVRIGQYLHVQFVSVASFSPALTQKSTS